MWNAPHVRTGWNLNVEEESTEYFTLNGVTCYHDLLTDKYYAFLGIAGDDSDLLCVASVFSQEELSEFDSDAYDAICELINIINGAYATKLSYEDIEVSLHPPVFYKDTQIKADNGMYVVTFSMNGHRFNLIMVADDKIKLEV